MKVYGKQSSEIIKLKNNFFEMNAQKLEEAKVHAAAYKKQPLRKNCKICDKRLPSPAFTKLGIHYAFCNSCGHMCGMNEDSHEFNKIIYSKNDGAEYAKNYYEENKDSYNKRVDLIYTPKAQFLATALQENRQSLSDMKIIDLGAGSGYFISALLKQGVSHLKGYEISPFQVRYANEMIGKKLLFCNQPDELQTIIKNSEVDIVSLIGVMEHLQDPISVLKSIKENKSINFIFFCVPMFSLSVFLEIAFSQSVMPRHLTGGHTHLFTNSSLTYIEDRFEFHRVSEWWFGSDIMDLYRSIYIHQESHDEQKSMTERWKDYFHDEIDQLQLILDRKHKSSQAHILWRVR